MNNISEKLQGVKNQLLSRLTKKEISDTAFNFKTAPQVNGSSVITMATIPDSNRITEEDVGSDFSVFGMKWSIINNNIAISLASSENGKYQIMSKNSGGIYLSLDYGTTWVMADLSDTIIYTKVTISSDGKYLSVIGSNGINISSDYGNNWDNVNSSSNFESIYMSSNGEIQYASTNSNLYFSNNYGLTWSSIKTGDNKVNCCSSNGQYVNISNSIIMYSNNYGVTFTNSNSPSSIWLDSKCSSTGQYQTAITNNGKIYTSDSYGKTWELKEELFDTLTTVTISGSGKYQLISGTKIYRSKDYGSSWYHVDINDIQINCVSLSFDGKVGILSSDKIYSSIISSTYIKESGMDNFLPLDESLFGLFESLSFDIELINNIYTEIVSEINLTNTAKIATSKTGKYVTLVINNGHIWRSSDFGETFIKNETIGVGTWKNIKMSNTGQYQTIITYDKKIWKSEDKGETWALNNTETFDLNDIAMSSSGKYQTICGSDGTILYSNDYGYIWTSTIINGNNLISITMSDDGKFQCVCDSVNIMYSKTYGIIWKYGNLLISDNRWNSISSSSCGQYVTTSSDEHDIVISEDYGVSWGVSLSGNHNWVNVFVTPSGKRQLAYDSDGKVYLSIDFGYTWEICYNTSNNWKSMVSSDTLQYVFALHDDGLVILKIINDDKIPGTVTISTNFRINSNAVILLSGDRSNIYTYDTDFTNSFDINSSDYEDNGAVSYAILNYGESIE